MIDSHAHLNFFEFDKDRDALLLSLLTSSIEVINIGTNYFSSLMAIQVSEKFERGVFAAIGLHPSNIESDFTIKRYGKDGERESGLEKVFEYEKYKKLLDSKKVVAIGEVGLDYWHKPKGEAKKKEFKDGQKKVFIEQLNLAKEFDLPLVIHSRMAFEDTFEILKNRNQKGVLHCFVGDKKEAESFLDLGYFLGLNGIIFKLDMEEVIKDIPLNRILLETDCPYLTPVGFENEMNNPFSLKIIAKEIARIKKIAMEEVLEITDANTRKLFNI